MSEPPKFEPYDHPDFPYKRREGIVGYIGIAVITVPFVGSIIGAILSVLTAASRGPHTASESAYGAFLFGWIIVGLAVILFAMYDFNNRSELRQKWIANFNKGWYQAERESEDRARREKQQAEEQRLYLIEEEKRDAERRRVQALRQRQEAEERGRRERIQAWQSAFDWARFTLEVQYQQLAMRLAAEQRVMDPAEVVRVFAVAYPHLDVASDWRMGCLRAIAHQDPRVAAILPHLPPPNAQNSKPA